MTEREEIRRDHGGHLSFILGMASGTLAYHGHWAVFGICLAAFALASAYNYYRLVKTFERRPMTND